MSLLSRPTRRYDYVADGAAIYDESFATIRARRRSTTCPPTPSASPYAWSTAPARPT